MARDALTGTRIRERRVMLSLKQSELARGIGISASYLNLIEHNRRRIGGKLLLDIADALGVEASMLTEGAEAALIGWSIIGIGDLILAPASARMFGAGEALIGFPLNLIPLFLGPPFGILLHLWTLRAFYLKRSAAGLAGAVG